MMEEEATTTTHTISGASANRLNVQYVTETGTQYGRSSGCSTASPTSLASFTANHTVYYSVETPIAGDSTGESETP